jgi:hypothetical protein
MPVFTQGNAFMLVEVNCDEAHVMLRAMHHVATLGSRNCLTDAGYQALVSALRVAFHLPDVTVEELPVITSRELALALADETQAMWAIRFLTVMALVDGVLDKGKIALVLEFAAGLDVRETYLRQLSEAIEGHLPWVLADMTRQNIRSLWDQPWREEDDVMTLFLPYSGDQADPPMAARHEALGSLPMGTLGRGYWEIYKKNGYAVPGDPQGVNVAFARPHDSTHVMSGYDTTPQGEILVSTFTAGMHPKLPMKGHILPVIFSWHLGIELNKLAGSFKGALDPEQFWVAWIRGAQMKIDLFSPDWDFWAHVEEPIEQLRQRYHVLPRSEK